MSSTSSSSILKKLVVTIVMSILYGAISISLDPRYADFITEQDFGDIRPAIFFPAIIAILYGPIVGGLTAAFGNLLYDATTNIYFNGESLEIDNLVGFVGNFAGAAVVGIFSKAYHNDNDPFSYRDTTEREFSDYFNLSFVRRLVRNTMAAVIGLSLITGLVIGYGLRLEPDFDPSLSFIVFTSIAFWNGIFLFIAIPIIYTTLSVFDFVQTRRDAQELEKRRNLDINVPAEYPFEFTEVGSPSGDELWNLEWGAMNMVIRNTGNIAHKYTVRVGSNDIFSPHRHTTPVMQPGETDEMYFNIYGITSGEKDSSIFVKVDDSYDEIKVPFTYEMGSSNELIFRKIMGMLLIIAFGVSILLIVLNIRDNLILDLPTLVALAALPVEIVLVLLFYIIWNNKRTKQLFKAMGFGHSSENVETQMMEQSSGEEDIALLEKIRDNRRKSTIYLLVAAPFFSFISYVIIAQETDNDFYSGDLIIAIIILLVIILAISDYYLEESERLNRQVLDSQELSEKIIRKAMTSGQPEVYQTTEIHLKLFNPFKTRGMRIFFHSIDNISPQELVVDEIEPQGVEVVTVNYTALQEGKRKFGLEVVQLTDTEGEIIPIEKATTFDQEVVEMSVSNTRILGLSQDQISLLRGAVAGVGSFSIAVTFISNILGYTIDQQFLQTTLPLLIILQVPVLWLSLVLKDKIKTSLDYQS